VKGFANWIDLLAILPFYLEIIAGDILAAFSVFRVIRLVRSAPHPAPQHPILHPILHPSCTPPAPLLHPSCTPPAPLLHPSCRCVSSESSRWARASLGSTLW
jgi:hypothetical protein